MTGVESGPSHAPERHTGSFSNGYVLGTRVDGGRGDWRGCTRIGTRFAMVPTKDSTQEADRHTQTVQDTQVKLM